MKNILFLFVFFLAVTVHGQDTTTFNDSQSDKVLNSVPALTTKNLPILIEHKRDGFHFNDGTIMRMPAFAKLLSNEGLGHVWDQYSGGLKTLNTGRGLLVAGLACNVMGGVVLLTSLNQEDRGKNTSLTAGTTVLLIGVVLDIVSIPLIIKGKNKTSDAMNQYNTYAKHRKPETSQVTLRLGSTSTGVGLIVDF